MLFCISERRWRRKSTRNWRCKYQQQLNTTTNFQKVHSLVSDNSINTSYISLSYCEGFIFLIVFFGTLAEGRQQRGDVMKLHTRSSFYLFYMLEYLFSDVLQFLIGVFVFSWTNRKMYLLVVTVFAVILVIFWYVILNLHPKSHSCLISPTSWYILDGVSASPHHDRW